jgi:hypothetical protein
MFRAIVTVFAGYWRPSWMTRVWVALFFLSTRLQARLGFAPSHLASDRSHIPSPISPTQAEHR